MRASADFLPLADSLAFSAADCRRLTWAQLEAAGFDAYLPECAMTELADAPLVFPSDWETVQLTLLRRAGPAELAALPEMGEGLENRDPDSGFAGRQYAGVLSPFENPPLSPEPFAAPLRLICIWITGSPRLPISGKERPICGCWGPTGEAAVCWGKCAKKRLCR